MGLLLIILWAASVSAAEKPWDAAGDIARLAREVPSIQAFGSEGIVWMDDFDYSLLADGTMRKERRCLLLLDRDSEIDSHVIQYPREESAAVEIAEASWFSPGDASMGGVLPVEEYDRDGIRCVIIRFPAESKGNVIAVSSVVTYPMRYYMDDVLPLAGHLPIWEEEVRVTVPEGMDVYWEGIGVRTPQRSRENGTERIAWRILNQSVWRTNWLVEEQRPMLLFSLQRGLISHLKGLATAEAAFRAPALPAAVQSAGGNLAKAGEAIHRYLTDRVLTVDGFKPEGIRAREFIVNTDKWTDWERTLIAGKWLQELGWDVKLFWCQKLPVGQLGPSSSGLWNEPVLRIAQSGGKDIFYHAGQSVDFGKLPPALSGLAVYRSDTTDVERLTLPKGSASEHILHQTWKLSMDESGIAEGTLELSASGAWVDALALGRTPEKDGLAARAQESIRLPMPGLRLEPQDVRINSNGYRIVFDVTAKMGISSGSDILMHMPAAIPACFDEIPAEAAKYTLKFPFLLERNVIVSTPAGYKPMMMPTKSETGDSKALFEDSFAHWPKRTRIESSSKWTVRTTAIDEYFSQRIAEQLAAVRRWSQTSIPLRK